MGAAFCSSLTDVLLRCTGRFAPKPRIRYVFRQHEPLSLSPERICSCKTGPTGGDKVFIKLSAIAVAAPACLVWDR